MTPLLTLSTSICASGSFHTYFELYAKQHSSKTDCTFSRKNPLLLYVKIEHPIFYVDCSPQRPRATKRRQKASWTNNFWFGSYFEWVLRFGEKKTKKSESIKKWKSAKRYKTFFVCLYLLKDEEIGSFRMSDYWCLGFFAHFWQTNR